MGNMVMPVRSPRGDIAAESAVPAQPESRDTVADSRSTVMEPCDVAADPAGRTLPEVWDGIFNYTDTPQHPRDVVVDHSDTVRDTVVDGSDTAREVWDVVIIGAGPAGCSAALYAAQGGLSALLLEKRSAGGQMTMSSAIDNWPGEPAPVDGITLGERMKAHAVRIGAVLRYGTAASLSLRGEIKTVTLAENPKEQIRTRNVILAMGTFPRTLGLPEEDALIGNGLSFCAACDGRLYRDQDVAVVGGGNTAFHDAEYLARLCRHVTLIHRLNDFQVPPVRLEALRRLRNVTILYPYAVSAYRTAADPVRRLTSLELTHAETGAVCSVDCDGVFLAVGSIPGTELVQGILPLTQTGAVVTDDLCRTAIPGVYAAGDCRNTGTRQILTACADGCTAALQISGK
ncbi:MAG: FAD-dependent oxidoreductase [Clostridia bacterium]|nr:FAD-dependent oxidoreductase [Clostridia bacterium]